MEKYTVILVLYDQRETRLYEVYAPNPPTALYEAVMTDMDEYPKNTWKASGNSFEVLRGHNLEAFSKANNHDTPRIN